jgi:hypothetical protein
MSSGAIWLHDERDGLRGKNSNWNMNGDGCRNRNGDFNTANNKNMKWWLLYCFYGVFYDFNETNTALQCINNDDHELRQCDCGMLFLICVICVVVMAAPWW